jgi:hypothetical protein
MTLPGLEILNGFLRTFFEGGVMGSSVPFGAAEAVVLLCVIIAS